jgi:hypothetical protein
VRSASRLDRVFGCCDACCEIPLGRIPSELDSVPRPKTFSGAVVVAGSLAPYDKKLMDGISKVTAATECLVSRGGSQGDPVGSVVRVYG